MPADGSLKHALIFKLGGLLQNSEGQSEDAKKELRDIIDYLNRHLIEIKSITPVKASKKKGVLFKYEYSAGGYEGETLEDVMETINNYLSTAAVTWAVADMTNRGPMFLSHMWELEKQIKKQQQGTRIKHGPEITDQLLRQPAIRQPDLWEALERDDKRTLSAKFGDAQAALTYINRKGQGINMSEDEEKMIQVIQELLHEKSQNKDEKKPDYFIGNPLPDRTNDKEQIPAAHLLISVTDAARKFSGQHRPGGREQETARRIITEIATDPDKQCLLQIRIAGDAVPKQKRRGRNKVLKTTVSKYVPLWTILDVKREMDNGQEDRELYLELHPIFRAGIEERSIRMPTLEAMQAAYGSSKMPKSVRRLIVHLAEAHTHIKQKKRNENGNAVHEVGQLKLFEQIAPAYAGEGKKKRYKRVQEQLKKGADTAVKLGMIEGISTRINQTGEIIYIFELLEGWRTGGNLEPRM